MVLRVARRLPYMLAVWLQLKRWLRLIYILLSNESYVNKDKNTVQAI
nr:MAG TPA: hypothetical protein [Caudoviricetes sp.]